MVSPAAHHASRSRNRLQRLLALVLMAVLALTVAGCGGDDKAKAKDKPAKKTPAASDTDTAPAKDDEAQPEATPKPEVKLTPQQALKQEQDWGRSVIEWSAQYSVTLSGLTKFFVDQENVQAVAKGDSAKTSEMYRILGDIGRCTETLDEAVTQAPTARLKPVRSHFAKSCDHYEEASELLGRGMTQKNSSDLQRASQLLGLGVSEINKAKAVLDKTELSRPAAQTKSK